MLSSNVNSRLIFDVLKKKTFSWLLAVFLFSFAYYYGVDKKIIVFKKMYMFLLYICQINKNSSTLIYFYN